MAKTIYTQFDEMVNYDNIVKIGIKTNWEDPDISDEKIADLLTAFEGAALHGWEVGDNQPKLNCIKKAIHDILGDEEQTEKAFAIIAKEKYNVTFEPERKPDSLEFQFGYSKDGKHLITFRVNDMELTSTKCRTVRQRELSAPQRRNFSSLRA